MVDGNSVNLVVELKFQVSLEQEQWNRLARCQKSKARGGSSGSGGHSGGHSGGLMVVGQSVRLIFNGRLRGKGG